MDSWSIGTNEMAQVHDFDNSCLRSQQSALVSIVVLKLFLKLPSSLELNWLI